MPWGDSQAIVLWVLWMQALMAFKARCFEGPFLQVELKRWGAKPKIWSQSFPPEGKTGTCEFSPNCVSAPGMGFIGSVCLSLFYLFHCGIFLICPMYRSYFSSFWIAFRENFSVFICKFWMSMGEDEFRNLLYCHLRPEFKRTIFLILFQHF